ncbi:MULTISPECIES: GldG family protein [unclassified Treponema]|uniref:GldG family protein n=1 Tax=unclassified Treponema TaxID=2638727 RepID=UPI000E8367FC|nr:MULTISPECIES: Gldg family protein [unclassified Treponema]HBP09638.1 ABC transporter [Treponema sp.]
MKKENKFVSWIKNPSADIWLFIVAVVLLNLVASRAFFRIDLTESKSYSLSSSSKEVVKNLEEPLNVKVFFSANLPAPYSNVEQYVKDILAEYGNSANKNFSCEFFDMEDYDNQRIARGYGLNQIQIRELKNNEVGLKNAFMGIVLSYADQIEKIDGISSSDGLEYKITSAIGKIISSTNILAGLSDNVKISLYKSESLEQFNIADFEKIDDEVDKAFSAANKKFKGRLDFNSENPDSEASLALGKKYGIQSVSWKNSDGKIEYGTIGLVVEYGPKVQLVPLRLTNAIFQYVVSGLDELEENIEECVKTVVSKTDVIAYVTGHGEHSLEDKNDSMYLKTLLADTYDLQEVNLLENEIPISAQSVIVNGPKEKFSDAELYKIDQFVLRGGNVIFFVDSIDETMPYGEMAYYSQPEYVPVENGLEKLFDNYGIKIGKEYVMDEKCFSQLTQQYGKLDFYYTPLIQKNCLDQKNLISKNLGNVFFPQTFEIDVSNVKENKDAKVSVIARTSEKSWTVPVAENFVLSPMSIFPPKEEDKFSSKNVAVLIEGKFKSAFEKSPFESDSENVLEAKSHLDSSIQNSKIFIASTSCIATAKFGLLQEDSQTANSCFVRNAVDYMNGKEDFCSMRTKNLSLNTLKMSSGKFALAVKYFNQVGLAVLVALGGLCVFILRRHHREKIRMAYDPEDPRQK